MKLQNDPANVVDLVQGRRYEIYPGQPRYSKPSFQSYRLRLENDKEAKFESADVEALSTMKLWDNRHDPVVASELAGVFCTVCHCGGVAPRCGFI